MNTSAISQQSATGQVARILALVIVLCLSAALGLVVGNALKGDQASEAQVTVERGSITAEASFSIQALGALHAARDGVAAGAPTYADPYRAYVNAATADDGTDASVTRPTPR